MSWGGNELADESGNDSIFQTPAGHNGVTFVAASGDKGQPGAYPAYSPNVVAVGGTSLTTDASGNYISESGWSNVYGSSGGGISQYEPRPSYQPTTFSNGSAYRPDHARHPGRGLRRRSPHRGGYL